MTTLKGKQNSVMVSLPLISLFVGIFLIFVQKSYAQNTAKYLIHNGVLISQAGIDQSDEDIDTESQKIKAMAARENQIKSLLGQAVDLYKQKQLQEAVELFDQVIRLDPQNSTAHFSLGIALEANNELSRATKEYEDAHNLEPNNKEYQQAATNAKKRLAQINEKELEESKCRVLASQAAEEFKQGHYAESLTDYKTLEKEKPNLALAKYNIGTIYLIQKKANEALPYYKAAYKLAPDNKQYKESFEKLEQSIRQNEETEKQNKASKKSEKHSPRNSSKSPEETTEKQDLITSFGMRVKSVKEGLLIEAILTGSRSAEAGLKPGDIITVFDGQKMKKTAQLEAMLQSKPVGQRFQILVIRGTQIGQIYF